MWLKVCNKTNLQQTCILVLEKWIFDNLESHIMDRKKNRDPKGQTMHSLLHCMVGTKARSKSYEMFF